MAKKILKKLDAFHWHEALDRSMICMEIVDRLILFHPAIESIEALKEKQKKRTDYCLKFIKKSDVYL